MSTADQPTAPTEEQVKAANEAEDAKWADDDFNEDDLKVPYKQEDDNDKSGDNSGDKDDEKGGANNALPNAGDDEDAGDESDHSEPTSLVTVDDPGEYKPADYSFEVTLADGKTKTIRTPEEAEELAEDPENFETPKQLITFNRNYQKMVTSQERDKEKYDDAKQKFDDQTEAEKARNKQIESYGNEFAYLEGKGLLPAVGREYRDADWSDPEVAKQDGVKEQLALLKYMVKENKARTKAGVTPITSVVDAFNAWQLDSGRKQEEAASKKAGEDRKAAGAKVAGVSPAQQGAYVPKGIAVGNPRKLDRSASVWDN